MTKNRDDNFCRNTIGLLYPGKKRGEYSLTPEGIKYVEVLLGIREPTEPEPPREPPAESAPSEVPEKDSPQRDRFFSLFKENGGKAEDDDDS